MECGPVEITVEQLAARHGRSVDEVVDVCRRSNILVWGGGTPLYEAEAKVVAAKLGSGEGPGGPGSAPVGPAGPPPGPGLPESKSGGSPPSRRFLVPGLMLVGVVAVVGVGAVFDPGGHGGSGHPDEWDARVTDLVAFVEDERGHHFEHPVAIDFLTEAEYAEATRSDAAELTDADRADLELTEGMMRALGLVEGDLDLFESVNDLSDTGTLAFYDPATDRVTVRGTDLSPALSATLVHELTHALQDQVFDIGALGAGTYAATSGEQTGARALVEGDAMRIEEAYVAEVLSAAERADLAAINDEGLDDLDAEEVPEALSAIFSLPYALGQGFVAALAADGAGAIDDAFEDPPTTEEHLLDPLSFLAGDLPATVAVEGPDGVEVLDEGDFGSASLMLVLASRIDALDALDAALGWDGDAYLSYQQDGRTCVDLLVAGEDDTAATRLRDAFTAWAAAGPDGTAEVSGQGRDTLLHACDPAGAAVAPHSAMDALTLVAVRSDVVAGGLADSGDENLVGCFTGVMLHEFTVEELTGDALTR